MSKTWGWVLGGIAVGCGIAVLVLAVQLSGAREDLRAAEDRATAAGDRITEAEEISEDLAADLGVTEDALARARRSLRKANAEPEPEVDLQTALDNGTAVPDPQLSAYSPPKRFTCVDRSCTALSQEYVFKNKSQDGSAVTCIFEVEYEGGGTTTFRWASEFVPPGGGTDTQRVYFYGDRPIGYLSDPDDDDCYRGFGVGSGGE